MSAQAGRPATPDVVVITSSRDPDARFVARAVRRHGGTVFSWHTDEISADQSLGLEVGAGRASAVVRTPQGTLDLLDPSHGVRSVWLRRMALPRLPAAIHPDDAAFAEAENQALLRAIFQCAFPGALWVNGWAAGRRAEAKLVQLLEARRVGLALPPTLISNDRADIESFMARRAEGQTLYKPFNFKEWTLGDGQRRTAFANRVTCANLPSAPLQRANPGIFQQFVDKRFDARLVLFGSTCIAAAIHGNGSVDWRHASRMGRSRVEPLDAPSTVVHKCLQMMRSLAIAYASFDFVVDHDGQYHFLELNEAGQFLWLEEVCPDLPLADGFARFLIHGDLGFDAAAGASTDRVTLDSVLAQA